MTHLGVAVDMLPKCFLAASRSVNTSSQWKHLHSLGICILSSNEDILTSHKSILYFSVIAFIDLFQLVRVFVVCTIKSMVALSMPVPTEYLTLEAYGRTND